MMGPNVKRLMCHWIAVMAIPPGGGLAVGLSFLKDPKRIAAAAKESAKLTRQVIDAVKAAPDNAWGDDDEAIAGAILEEIEQSKIERIEAMGQKPPQCPYCGQKFSSPSDALKHFPTCPKRPTK